jgi:hypothetical protein
MDELICTDPHRATRWLYSQRRVCFKKRTCMVMLKCGCSDNLRLQSTVPRALGLHDTSSLAARHGHLVHPLSQGTPMRSLPIRCTHVHSHHTKKHSPFHRKGSKETLLRSRPFQSWACRRTTGEQTIFAPQPCDMHASPHRPHNCAHQGWPILVALSNAPVCIALRTNPTACTCLCCYTRCTLPCTQSLTTPSIDSLTTTLTRSPCHPFTRSPLHSLAHTASHSLAYLAHSLAHSSLPTSVM